MIKCISFIKPQILQSTVSCSNRKAQSFKELFRQLTYSAITKRILKVLPLNEKVKVLGLRKDKNYLGCSIWVAKIYG